MADILQMPNVLPKNKLFVFSLVSSRQFYPMVQFERRYVDI